MQPSIQLTTPQILQIARACEYLTVVDSHTKSVLKGGDINFRQAQLIYMERRAVQHRYNLNSADPTLIATGNYLFSLLRNWPFAQNLINQIGAGIPVISNPNNVTISAGQNATFSVTVSSSTPYTIQWYRNGAAIPGAKGLSYTLVDALTSDSGAVFNAVATNAAGNASSLNALLTVNSALTAQWGYFATDPYPALSGGSDTLSYQISETITHNAAIVVNYPSGAYAAPIYTVLRYPNTENDKTTWVNTSLNQGNIPDSVMRPILNTNGFKYVVSRVLMALDPTTTTLTYQ
jgi:hypothetical protein